MKVHVNIPKKDICPYASLKIKNKNKNRKRKVKIKIKKLGS
jgi:hypothetical protein